VSVGTTGTGVGVGGSGVGAGAAPTGMRPTSSSQNCSSIPKKGSGTKENSSLRSFQVSSIRTNTVIVEFSAVAETWNSGQILNSQLSKERQRSWLHTTLGEAGSVPPVGSMPTRRPTALSTFPAGSNTSQVTLAQYVIPGVAGTCWYNPPTKEPFDTKKAAGHRGE